MNRLHGELSQQWSVIVRFLWILFVFIIHHLRFSSYDVIFIFTTHSPPLNRCYLYARSHTLLHFLFCIWQEDASALTRRQERAHKSLRNMQVFVDFHKGGFGSAANNTIVERPKKSATISTTMWHNVAQCELHMYVEVYVRCTRASIRPS